MRLRFSSVPSFRHWNRSDVLALVALLLSVGSLVVSLFVSFQQNKQWDLLNLGRVELVDSDFISWRTIPIEEARATKWGYEVLLTRRLENGEVTGEIRVLSRLVPFELATKRDRFDIAAVTLEEVSANVREHVGDADSAVIRKYFQFEFGFMNLGATIVNQLEIAVQVLLPDSKTWSDLQFSQAATLSPGRKVGKTIDLYMDPQQPFPEKLNFRMTIRYVNVNGEDIQVETQVYYLSANGKWKIGE